MAPRLPTNYQVIYCSISLLLSACASSTECPVPKQWPIEEQMAIAREREKLPPDNILRPVLDDWERLRRELR